VEQNLLNKKVKTITAYFGELVFDEAQWWHIAVMDFWWRNSWRLSISFDSVEVVQHI